MINICWVLHVLYDLILTMILWCIFYYYPHFTNEDTKAQKN